MAERVCENCRWWSAGPTGYGYCRKRPPIVSSNDESFPSTHKSVWCGEWSDASITPEQEDRQELTRRFAVAIMSTEYAGNLEPDRVWSAAESFAEANPRFQKENKQ